MVSEQDVPGQIDNVDGDKSQEPEHLPSLLRGTLG